MEQFISWLNDDGMVYKMLKEVATLDYIEDAMNEHIMRMGTWHGSARA